MIRLNKVARELNVGIQTLIDILHKNGYADERFTPNTQINKYKNEIIAADIEIRRLKNISWIQKLFRVR